MSHSFVSLLFFPLKVTLHITCPILSYSAPSEIRAATWRLTGGWSRRRDWRPGTLPPGGKLLPTQQLRLRQHRRQGRRCPAPFQLTGWKWLSLLATFLSAPASQAAAAYIWLSSGPRRDRRGGESKSYREGSRSGQLFSQVIVPLHSYQRGKSDEQSCLQYRIILKRIFSYLYQRPISFHFDKYMNFHISSKVLWTIWVRKDQHSIIHHSSADFH